MKLTRYIQDGKTIPSVFADANTLLDCSSFGEDWNEAFFENNGLQRLQLFLAENSATLPTVNASSVTLAPAIARPSKTVCIGLNYTQHAKEMGMELPAEPVIFFKSTSAWTGPYDQLVIPRHSNKTDWEVELAIVIGKKAKYVSQENALDYIAGYAIHNDYSEREWQKEKGGQWVKGKSADTFSPFGPFMATKDEIPDPNKLNVWLNINGNSMQNSTTADFIFNVQYLVSYVSQFMTLFPGDVISTGTPGGVGLGQNPPKFIQPGDVIELGIDGLGYQRQIAIKEA